LRRVRRRVRPDHIPEFFKRDLVLLKTEMGAVLTDEASRLKVVKLPAAPRVRVQTSSEPGWLDFQVDYEVEGHAISLEAVRGAEGKNLRPDPYLYVEVPVGESNRVVRGLEELQPVETSEGYRIPISRFASLEGFIEELGGQSEVDAAYQQFLEELEGFQADKAFRLSDAIEQDLLRANIRLYDHQRAGIHWLTWLADHHLHGLLADDMGLGKTIQTATALRWAWEQSAPERHSLIVCPKSVIRHWHRELKRCFPGLDVYEYIGTGRNRNIWNRSTPTVMISTYSTVARDVEAMAEVPLFFLVLDESTKIKNPETQRSQAVKALNAAHRIALSGTPVENRPAELWSVFDYLMRGHLGRYGTFQRMFETPIMEGDAAAAGRLGKRIGPFLLRRRKEEVAEDLPDKVEMEEWVELTAEQRRLYKSIQGQEAREVRRSLQ
jgi:SNF2 family DNA or RNA helicase